MPPLMGLVLLQEETGVPGKKPAMLGRDKLDNTLLTRGQGNFNQITAWKKYFHKHPVHAKFHKKMRFSRIKVQLIFRRHIC